MIREKRRVAQKKYFTVEQANKTLPLVRAIVTDIAALAAELQQRQELLGQRKRLPPSSPDDPYHEEYQQIQAELARGAARLEELIDELRDLGVELKGFDGLVDFPSLVEGREVYLCWKLGEPEITHWHELDAGFAGRQKLVTGPALSSDEPVIQDRT